jgi:hemerythrin
MISLIRKRGETHGQFIDRQHHEIIRLHNLLKDRTVQINELVDEKQCVPVSEYNKLLQKYQELVERLKSYSLWVG